MLSQETAWLLGEKYGGEKSEAFFADLASLEAGTPLAYLIGHIPFLDTTIYLDSRPLIPRTETEFWTNIMISELKESKSEDRLHILDLCAGSGAIGVAIAKALPLSTLHFIELDSSHLPTIARNCRENSIVPERVTILAGDIFKTSTDLPRFDVIVTNPPYIDPILDRTEDSVKAFEPEVALYGGVAGMEAITKIIAEAPSHLVQSGLLYIEHEPEQSEEIEKLGKAHFLVTTLKDQYGQERFSKLVLQ